MPWDRLRPAWFHLVPALGTVFPENGTTVNALLAAADAALWRNKHESRAAEAS